MRAIWQYVRRLLSRRASAVAEAPSATAYVYTRPGYCFTCKGQHDVQSADLYILLDPRPANGYTCTRCGGWDCLPLTKTERMLLQRTDHV